MAILLTLTREEESLQNGTFCSTQTTCTPRGAQNEFLILSHFTCTSGGSSMSAFAQFCPYPPQPQSKIYPSIDWLISLKHGVLYSCTLAFLRGLHTPHPYPTVFLRWRLPLRLCLSWQVDLYPSWTYTSICFHTCLTPMHSNGPILCGPLPHWQVSLNVGGNATCLANEELSLEWRHVRSKSLRCASLVNLSAFKWCALFSLEASLFLGHFLLAICPRGRVNRHTITHNGHVISIGWLRPRVHLWISSLLSATMTDACSDLLVVCCLRYNSREVPDLPVKVSK